VQMAAAVLPMVARVAQAAARFHLLWLATAGLAETPAA